MTETPYHQCPDCLVYAGVRMTVLWPVLAERRGETGETGEEILDRYMGGVHARHLAGLPIIPSEVPA
jgi:hypothetical protein